MVGLAPLDPPYFSGLLVLIVKAIQAGKTGVA
jgi:hypothetical protein